MPSDKTVISWTSHTWNPTTGCSKVTAGCKFCYAEPISVYTREQAVEDGELVEIFKSRWAQLTNGRSMAVTRSLFAAFSLAAFVEMWNEYVVAVGRGRVERGDYFQTKMNGEPIWIVEDGDGITFLRPEER